MELWVFSVNEDMTLPALDIPVHAIHLEDSPSANSSLQRYRHILDRRASLEAEFDYMFIMNADSWVCNAVGNQMFLGPCVVSTAYTTNDAARVVTHEQNPLSNACIFPFETVSVTFNRHLQGGPVAKYLDICEEIVEQIEEDEENEITACMLDESHWNRYILDHAGSVKPLPAAYDYPHCNLSTSNDEVPLIISGVKHCVSPQSAVTICSEE